jgi:hypothetical protein
VNSFTDSKTLKRSIAVDEIADFTIANPLPSWPPLSGLKTDFHEPGGSYPQVAPPKSAGAGTLIPLQMVASIDPEGHPAVVVPVHAGPDSTRDGWWIEQVTAHWKWPAGSWRQYRIEVPVAAP